MNKKQNNEVSLGLSLGDPKRLIALAYQPLQVIQNYKKVEQVGVLAMQYLVLCKVLQLNPKDSLDKVERMLYDLSNINDPNYKSLLAFIQGEIIDDTTR